MRRFPTFAALAALTLLAPPGVSGQDAADPDTARTEATRPDLDRPERQRAEWLPDTTAFAPLLAAPRETGLRGSFLLADRSRLVGPTVPPDADGGSEFVTGDFDGRNVEASVALGHRIPVVMLRREDARGPTVVLEFEVGTFSRFFMETAEKDLINIDYRVGIPLSVGWRAWEGRAEIRHLSSHLGDDFARRFGVGERQVSMEGVELLVARRFGPTLRAYVGGEANLHANDDIERTAGRVGLELDRGTAARDLSPRPYAALDLRMNAEVERLEGALVAGIAFRLRGARVGLEARGHFGPSAMGWLRDLEESYWGLGLRVEP